ncbi:MAG: protein kinase domain-containing protein, partial [Candidatus Acidiferrales bacterium]
MIGQRLAQYLIVERIGAGGMGEVYRARDERLERDVAIKVLPAGTLADEAARRRFRQEALALARLNHPHIATVHDFNSQDGVDFLVMEHVPGSSLAEKLAAGPLSEKETLRLGAQVAAALEEAHGQRIVHRDLKPGNIVLTSRGDVKVLDFGLAKLLQPTGGEAVTAESFAETRAGAGTLPYMAPEQLRGEPVDARTDIHALGAVLYEMSTGRRPFPETQGPRLIDSILNSVPALPSRHQPRLSAELERIILKCLEKDPERRYQSPRELRVDLERLAAPSAVAAPLVQPSGPRRWAIPTAAMIALLLAVLLGFNLGGLRDRLLGRVGSPQIQSLAVLPLDNLSGNPEQEYFVDGMHEELITRLAKISALKVISRTSVMRYRGERRPPLPEIGRELGVDAVIEGSVRRSGDQVRITVQLVEAATDKHLWAESYQRDLRDVLALQSDVAQAIADEIRITLTAQERASLSGATRVNPQAYEAYLKGRFYWNKRSPAGLLKGMEYFNQAIEHDPQDALAYSGLADSYTQLAYRGQLSSDDAYPRAKAAATKALEINSTLAEAHASLGFIYFNYEWDWPGAEKEFLLAIKLNPNYAESHHWYSHFLMDTGRVP